VASVPERVVEPGAPIRERRAPSRRKKLVPYALLAPGGLWLFVFFILPVVLMLGTSLKSGGLLSGGGFRFTWEWSNYGDALTTNAPFFRRSLSYSAAVTILGLVLMYPLAYWIAFYGGRWKSSLLLLMLLPFFVSFVIRTVQWKFILGDYNPYFFGFFKDLGLLPQDFKILTTPWGVIAGITYNYMPFTALPLYVSLERIDKGLVEAAKDLYASKWAAFRKVVFPLSLPGVFAAFLLTFVPATGDYVNSDILGSAETFMIGQRIQTKFLTDLDYPAAAALSIILMIGMVILASIYARVLGSERATDVAAGT